MLNLSNLDPELRKELETHIATLPVPVKKAMESADTSRLLRDFAKKYQLHLDQWGKLETEVYMVMVGLAPIQALASNLQVELGIGNQLAGQLSADVNTSIFAPVRKELEHQLDHVAAQSKTGAPIEDMTAQILETARPKPPQNTETPVIVNSETQQNSVTETRPGQVTPDDTQPQQKESSPEQKAEKTGPTSGAYAPGKPSSERKEVHDDPYRESVE